MIAYGDQTLPQCLSWYLEDYLLNPHGPSEKKAAATIEALKEWGRETFQAVFDFKTYSWYSENKNQLDQLQIRIVSQSPAILSWPWEALCDGDFFLAPHCCLERSPDPEDSIPPAPGETDRLRMLLVIARPKGENDVGYHAVARAVVDCVRKMRYPVDIDVLRPPTFRNLRETLNGARREGKPYHIVHFDGHGGYGVMREEGRARAAGTERFQGAEGCLAFETEPAAGQDVKENLVKASELGQVLFQCGIPMVVMNACQSAMIDEQAESAYASVAAKLLSAGVSSVTAMGYSLYVSGAQEFVPKFYAQLFRDGNPASAMREGRLAMFDQKERNCVLGKLPLQDWIVPELYQKAGAGERLLPVLRPSEEESAWKPFIEPDDALEQDVGGFIGRGQAILELERLVLRKKAAGVLIYGMAGAGKTTLAKGFLSWLLDTGGLREADGSPCPVIWFDFRDIGSGTYVVRHLAETLLKGGASPNEEENLRNVVSLLRKKRAFVVWDNFESATGAPGTPAKLPEEDRQYLKQFLEKLKGGRSKVLITSRTEESWLPDLVCARIKRNLEGLEGEELWAYCGQVADEVGVTLDPEDEDLLTLLDSLDGNPLVVRSVLLRLKDTEPAALSKQLGQAFCGAPGDESTRRIQAAFAVLTQGVAEDTRPALQALGLHEHYADADYLALILHHFEQIEESDAQAVQKNKQRVARCFVLLESAGLCSSIGNGIYKLHPALRSCLAERFSPPEELKYWFAWVMDGVECHYHNVEEQRRRFMFVHEANIRHAQEIAEALDMREEDLSLTVTLAIYANDRGGYRQAETLWLRLADKARKYGRPEEESRAYRQLSTLFSNRGDLEGEKRWAQRAVDVWKNVDAEKLNADILFTLGNQADTQGDFKTAMNYYEQAAIQWEQSGDRRVIPLYNLLANLSVMQDDNEARQKWLDKFWEAAEKNEDLQEKASASRERAGFAEDQGDLPKAEEWYRRSLALFKQLGDQNMISFSHRLLGDLYVKMEQPGAAKAEYNEALSIAARLGLKQHIAACYDGLGDAVLLEGVFTEAKGWWEAALNLYEELNNEEFAAIIRKKMQKLDDLLKKYKH